MSTWVADVSGPDAGGMFGDEDCGIGFDVCWTHPDHPRYRVLSVYGVCARQEEQREADPEEVTAYLAGHQPIFAGLFTETEHGLLFEPAVRYWVDEMTMFEVDENGDENWDSEGSQEYGEGSYLSYDTVEAATAEAERMARREASCTDYITWTPWDVSSPLGAL